MILLRETSTKIENENSTVSVNDSKTAAHDKMVKSMWNLWLGIETRPSRRCDEKTRGNVQLDKLCLKRFVTSLTLLYRRVLYHCLEHGVCVMFTRLKLIEPIAV